MAAPMDFRKFSGSDLQAKRKSAYKVLKFDDISEIGYDQFFHEYLVPNKPCILDQSVTERWKSRTDWVTDDGSPDFGFLRKYFGKATVPVANCKQEQYSSHPKQDLTMKEYLKYWQDLRENDYPADEACLYLKDWHFTKEFPEYEAYHTPIYFQSDWLNEFWETRPLDDYRFVYMGPKGTWTPFHSDVYRSFSWSANICGKKKWIFYPPGCEDYMKDKFGNLIYDVTSPELEDVQKYPYSDKVKGQQLEVIQGQGQIIFVPSGWHHQVYNLEDTISINHNWLNGCNIDICWRHLQGNLQNVKREIEDLKDMEGWNEQCQLILNASAGINYETFIQMLKVITINRLKLLGIKVMKSNIQDTMVDELRDAKSVTSDKSNIQGIMVDESRDTKSRDTITSDKSNIQSILVDEPRDSKSVTSDNSGLKTKSEDDCDRLRSKMDELLENNEVVRDSNSGVRTKVKGTVCDEKNFDNCCNKDGEDKVDKSNDSRDTTSQCAEVKGTVCDEDLDKCGNEDREEKVDKSIDSKDATDQYAELIPKLSDTINGLHVHLDDGDDERVVEKSCTIDSMTHKDYIMYDLHKVKETIEDIMRDEDYIVLNFEGEQSAEFVLDLIESNVDLPL